MATTIQSRRGWPPQLPCRTLQRRLAAFIKLCWLASLLAVPSVHADVDRLRLPADISDNARQALMLDITHAGQRLVAVGDRGYVLLSDDSGQSWRQAEVPVSVALTAVTFVDEQRGWAVGHSGVVLNTIDGGEHWALQLDGNRINLLVAQSFKARLDDQQAQLETLSGDARQTLEMAIEELSYALDDAEAALDDGPTKPLLDVWFKNSDEGFVVGAYGMILKTVDGGESWIPMNDALPNVDGFHYNQIASIGIDALMMVGEAGTLYRSLDDGQHWQALDSPYEGSFFGLQPLEEGRSLLVYGLRGNAFVSSDKGDSWQAVSMPSRESIMASVPSAEGVLLMGGGGSLWRSVDSVDTFSPVQLSRALPITAAAWASPGQLAMVGYGGIRLIELQANTEEN